MRNNDNIIEAFLFILFISFPCSSLIIYIFGWLWGSLILFLTSLILGFILAIIELSQSYTFKFYIYIILIIKVYLFGLICSFIDILNYLENNCI